MRILRADGQIEWLSMLTVMHGLREARQSMLSARARDCHGSFWVLRRLHVRAVMCRQPSSLHARARA